MTQQLSSVYSLSNFKRLPVSFLTAFSCPVISPVILGPALSIPASSVLQLHAGISVKVCERGTLAGAGGNVLINEKTDRLNSYNVWNYAEGQDSYQSSMMIDLTQPPGKVSDLLGNLRKTKNAQYFDYCCIYFPFPFP